MNTRILVLGGARSGKSSHAEAIAATAGEVDYLATSENRPDDPEWQARIALHRARRPRGWATIETINVAAELVRDTDRMLLVDCLTVWLTRQMDAAGVWTAEPDCDEILRTAVDGLVKAIGACRRPVIMVSNEVGQGIVPLDAGTRRFRDEMGILNAKVAAAVNRVDFCIAGIPQRLK
ncbi:hypothetical protein HMPREF1531_01844 [Propionibacterium sp. oral taxon 192 str. F0372]|uniref:bifunctional adenosylcobinamide kinase/adenosylcobinamide-phosphate guanylyltransferase n=1 Tax=Propionibacterium sp. oral taxon 192 TaxID=671222 RepID=UPI0003530A50|nr:bifunctional adenosylcobinamide kinase/adenosylcobinamide-phosphate guanylyltransferase [Propionibacterium sp. oral taxon 192]EPH02536.1 hypothetical protein HMPREF1531_01844 [Propionibacterium sp. oral taxon 192 str. F0372]